ILQELVDLRRGRKRPSVDPVIERALPARVPAADDASLSRVPDDEGKITKNVHWSTLTPFLVGTQNELAIARRYRWMPGELGQQVLPVVQSRVGDRNAAGPRADDRLTVPYIFLRDDCLREP